MFQKISNSHYYITNRCSWFPRIRLKNINTNGTILINIRMINFGIKFDFRRFKWIFIAELNIYFKCTTFIWTIWCSFNKTLPMSYILVTNWSYCYIRNRIFTTSSKFLLYNRMNRCYLTCLLTYFDNTTLCFTTHIDKLMNEGVFVVREDMR
jgi:hypothetical protein